MLACDRYPAWFARHCARDEARDPGNMLVQGRAARCNSAATTGDTVQLLGVSSLGHAVGVLPALGGVDHRAARRARELLSPRRWTAVRALSGMRLRDLLGRPREGTRPAHGHQHALARPSADGQCAHQGPRWRQDLAHARRVREAGDVDLAIARAGAPGEAAARAPSSAVIDLIAAPPRSRRHEWRSVRSSCCHADTGHTLRAKPRRCRR